MAENFVKRTTVFQIHCSNCDNDTVYNEKSDFATCSVCRACTLWYVAEREGRVKTATPPSKEQASIPLVTTRDKVANPKEILAKV
jgi:hypothetical protein